MYVWFRLAEDVDYWQILTQNNGCSQGLSADISQAHNSSDGYKHHHSNGLCSPQADLSYRPASTIPCSSESTASPVGVSREASFSHSPRNLSPFDSCAGALEHVKRKLSAVVPPLVILHGFLHCVVGVDAPRPGACM
jgi:hypothetical protein